MPACSGVPALDGGELHLGDIEDLDVGGPVVGAVLALGRLASGDLKQRCADGLEHSTEAWAARKRALSEESSSRWAGSITKAGHDQWALARRCQLAHIQSLEAGIRPLMHRLSQPIGEKGTKRAPGGYRSEHEWFHKSRRLHTLTARLEREKADRDAGIVHVVRGGRRLLNNRHNLALLKGRIADPSRPPVQVTLTPQLAARLTTAPPARPDGVSAVAAGSV